MSSLYRKQIKALVVLSLLAGHLAFAQTRKEFRLPNIPGYLTLKGDFHMHTPFSDGTVWPTDRVMEAWRDGLDVIAITDHVEYNPNKKDVSTDLNRPYEIAKPKADELGILLVQAAEITRPMPPGHFNVFFIEDANALKKENVDDAFKAAEEQNAFFVWNHPGWKAQQPDTTLWFPKHDEYYAKGWLNGIEVFNETEYYPIVHQWAHDKKLTYFANSDIHDPVDFLYYNHENKYRPLTLVFARDRSIEAVRDAFDNQRTLALFNDTLVGPEALMKALIEASLSLTFSEVTVNPRKQATIILNNHSDVAFQLAGIDSDECHLPAAVTIAANSAASIRLTNIQKSAGESILASFLVKNALPEPGKPLKIELQIGLKSTN